MAFKDILGLLFERAKKRGEVKTQEEFADIYSVSRPTMNLYLNGKIPPPGKIDAILTKAGYEIADCIQLPEIDSLREKYKEMFADLETILLSGDKDRIQGIATNLEDLAAAAKSGKRPRRSITVYRLSQTDRRGLDRKTKNTEDHGPPKEKAGQSG